MFFFSSRRRHTRLQGDWSSDVCSSDLSYTLHAVVKGPVSVSLQDIPFLTALQTILAATPIPFTRSEEHTSELQSPCNLVCRLLLEKKKTAHALGDVAEAAVGEDGGVEG